MEQLLKFLQYTTIAIYSNDIPLVLDKALLRSRYPSLSLFGFLRFFYHFERLELL